MHTNMMGNLSKLFGVEEDELRDILIAFAVILFFAYIVYAMGWFRSETDDSLAVVDAPVVSSDLDLFTNTAEADCSSRRRAAKNEDCLPEPPKADTVAPAVVSTLATPEVVASSEETTLEAPILDAPTLDASAPVTVDSDQDGFADEKDACPLIAGDQQGCPIDSDGDGVHDAIDRCPQTSGSSEHFGCLPDADGDGVTDSLDQCPNKAGTLDNQGCPQVVVSEQDRKTIQDAVANVQFFSNSARPTESSEVHLKRVAEILEAKPDYKLKISGHTDSQGNPESNLFLSKKRAFACFSYLVNYGIPSNRLSYKWFGDTQPVADNETADGRRKNRRVEFELHY